MQRRKLVETIQLPEFDPAIPADNEDGSLTRSGMGTRLLQDAVLPADLTMRPEITAHAKVERPDLAFPDAGVHDGIHIYSHDFRLARQQTLAFYLISNHLLGAKRFPVRWIESEKKLVF